MRLLFAAVLLLACQITLTQHVHKRRMGGYASRPGYKRVLNKSSGGHQKGRVQTQPRLGTSRPRNQHTLTMRARDPAAYQKLQSIPPEQIRQLLRMQSPSSQIPRNGNKRESARTSQTLPYGYLAALANAVQKTKPDLLPVPRRLPTSENKILLKPFIKNYLAGMAASSDRTGQGYSVVKPIIINPTYGTTYLTPSSGSNLNGKFTYAQTDASKSAPAKRHSQYPVGVIYPSIGSKRSYKLIPLYGKNPYSMFGEQTYGPLPRPVSYSRVQQPTQLKNTALAYGPPPISVGNGYGAYSPSTPATPTVKQRTGLNNYGRSGYGYGQSSGGYGLSSSGYGASSGGYESRSTGYAGSSGGYGGSSSGYGSNLGGYGTGSVGYGSSADSYGVISGGSVASSGGYGASSGGYGAKSDSYGASSGGYGASSDGYGSSSGGYGASSGRNRVLSDSYGVSSSGYGANSGGYGASSGGYDTYDCGYAPSRL